MHSDYLFGHVFFQSAIDLAVLAKSCWQVNANVKPNWPEAKRLYKAAISDAKAGIADLENPENSELAKKHHASIQHMREQISMWEGTIYSMP